MALVTLVIGVKGHKAGPHEFENRLTQIVTAFRNSIMDEGQCAIEKKAADNLADDIQEAIKQTDQYTDNEISDMKQLRREAVALEEYISAVGGCGIDYPSIQDFNLAINRVKASVVMMIKDKYCVDILYVTIGNYKVFLLQNTTVNTLTVVYQYKTASGSNSGRGTIGLSNKSLRNFCSNRHNKALGSIVITGISCSIIGSNLR